MEVSEAALSLVKCIRLSAQSAVLNAKSRLNPLRAGLYTVENASLRGEGKLISFSHTFPLEFFIFKSRLRGGAVTVVTAMFT